MNEDKLTVTEGVTGVWFYHLSYAKTPTKSLCGKDVMSTNVPFESWGFKTELNEGYCQLCKELSTNAY